MNNINSLENNSSSFWGRVGDVIERVIYSSFPILVAFTIRRNVQSEVSTLLGREAVQYYNDRINLDNIQKIHSKEWERKKVVEDKAKTNVTTVTIAVTFISLLVVMVNGTNTSLIFSQMPGFEKVLLLITFALTFIYLLSSGMSALIALELNQYYDIYLNEELYLSTKPEQERVSMIIECIELNQCYIAMREAFVISSYKNMFNALVSMVVLLLLATYFFMTTSTPNATEVIIQNDKGEERIIKLNK